MQLIFFKKKIGKMYIKIKPQNNKNYKEDEAQNMMKNKCREIDWKFFLKP